MAKRITPKMNNSAAAFSTPQMEYPDPGFETMGYQAVFNPKGFYVREGRFVKKI